MVQIRYCIIFLLLYVHVLVSLCAENMHKTILMGLTPKPKVFSCYAPSRFTQTNEIKNNFFRENMLGPHSTTVAFQAR